MVSIKANVFFFKKTSPSTFVSTKDKTLDVNKNLLVRHDLAQLFRKVCEKSQKISKLY